MKYFNECILEAWDNIADDKLIELGMDWIRQDKTTDGFANIINEAYKWWFDVTLDDDMKALDEKMLKNMFTTSNKTKFENTLKTSWEIYTRHSKKHPIAKSHLEKGFLDIGKQLNLPVFFL